MLRDLTGGGITIPVTRPARTRAEAFCGRFGLRLPILLAPMAGACPPSLSTAVVNTGGVGAYGALLMQLAAIIAWAAKVRAGTNGPFQLNLWVPDPAPARDPAHEAEIRPSSPSEGRRSRLEQETRRRPTSLPNTRRC